MQDGTNYPTADTIGNLCIKKYRELPKTGKPTAKEWTVLSGVVLHNMSKGCSTVIALGLGTKCIGQDKLCSNGLILNDSHAEVLARRALLRYIYHQINNAQKGLENTIFVWNEEYVCFSLKPEYSFHFLSTHTPCGDACISWEPTFPMQDEFVPIKKQKLETDLISTTINNSDVGQPLFGKNDVVYTGAKLLDKDQPDAMTQTVGAVRYKPGRGVRTLSMSCSDKLAKWVVLGWQGALLDALLEQPLHFATFNFYNKCKHISLERAIYGRFAERPLESVRYNSQKPQIRVCSTAECFEHAQDEQKQPSPNGLVWCDISEKLKPYEISVHGKRQGVTAKKLDTPRAALKISKYALLQEFVGLLQTQNKLLEKFAMQSEELQSLSYKHFKQLAKEYQKAWSVAKNAYFREWTQKPPELLNFSLESLEKK